MIDRKAIARTIPVPEYVEIPYSNMGRSKSFRVGPNQSAGAFYNATQNEDPSIVHLTEAGDYATLNVGLTAGEATALAEVLVEQVEAYNARLVLFEKALFEAEAKEAQKALGDKVNYETPIGNDSAIVRGFTQHGTPAMYVKVVLGPKGRSDLFTDSEAIALADAIYDTVEARKA